MIRDMARSDAEAVVGLVVAAGMFTADEAVLVRDLLDAFPRDSDGDQHGCLVDEEDGRVVGVAYYQPKGPADRLWDLTMIAVAPRLQGAGRGSALLRRMEDDLRARPADAARRHLRHEPVRPDPGLLRACGYTQVARVPDYGTDDDDLVVFAKRLG